MRNSPAGTARCRPQSLHKTFDRQIRAALAWISDPPVKPHMSGSVMALPTKLQLRKFPRSRICLSEIEANLDFTSPVRD